MPEKSFTLRFGILASSAVFFLISLVSPFLRLLSSQARLFLEQHKIDPNRLEALRALREGKKRSYLFFCSSAGEYEQAKPVLDRLSRSMETFLCIIFFSHSGFSFAQKRGEGIPFFMSPLDTIGLWEKVFRAISPNATIIIRHELWPSFLYCASGCGHVYLLDGSVSSTSPVKLFLKKRLYSFIELFFTVSEKERKAFIKAFSLPEAKIQAIGDTKYDRVWERAKRASGSRVALSPSTRKLIVGSAWWKDCELALAAFWRCRNEQMPDLKLILAPHSPSAEFLSWLAGKCDETTFTWGRLSVLEDPNSVDILIVDSVGILFELYSQCHFAFVGGALHYEVHNVLEPAAHGLPIAFGPLYQNSHEAMELVSHKLASVIHDEGEFYDWIIRAVNKRGKDEALLSFLEKKTGAADRFVTFLLERSGSEAGSLSDR